MSIIIHSTQITIINFLGGTDYVEYSFKHKKYTLLQNVLLPIYSPSTSLNQIQLNDGETFDGNNFAITIDNTYNNGGLFVLDSKSKKTTIKNLTINGTTYGSLVDLYQSNFTIDNCSNKRNNDLTQSVKIYGGICGSYCSNFVIKTSTNYGTISSGGFAGSYCTSFKIKKCINLGNFALVNPMIPSFNSRGGIIGSNCTDFKIYMCINNSNGIPLTCGGITGSSCNSFEVKKCINSSTIGNQQINDSAGGIIGPYCFKFVVKKCINNGNIYNGCSGIIATSCFVFETYSSINNGIINQDCSGIIGNDCSSFTVSHCKNYGEIIGLNINGTYTGGAGGICGQQIGIALANINISIYNTGVIIKNCVNHGNITGVNSGGIVSTYFACNTGNTHTEQYTSASNGKFIIKNCTNIGKIITANRSTSGGICASYCGVVIRNTNIFNKIKIKNCYSKHGNIISGNCLQNSSIVVSGSAKDNNNVYTKLYIYDTHTRRDIPLIYGFGTILNEVTAKYIKTNGKKINLLTHTDY